MEQDPKSVISQQINNLKWRLCGMDSDVGDWKVSKCQEYVLAGLESPYDIAVLHAKRQAIRDEINRLEAELNAE